MATLIGLLIGLLAAFLQSVSYVYSSRYMRECGRGTITLLSPSFVIMSAVSLLALPVLIPESLPPLRTFLPAAFFCIGFCLVGHAGLFFMLKSVDASRASPLLAIKVPLLALFYCLTGIEKYTAVQWVGILLVVLASWLLCKAGRRIPLRALGWLLVGCMGYSASDFCIKIVLDAFKPVCGSFLHYSLLTLFMIYAAGGAFGLMGMILSPRIPWRIWKEHVLPYSFFWFTAMMMLFMCFAMSGIVGGNIVQSTRGLISVVMGWILAKAGYNLLEETVSRAVFHRRILSAVLIILAMMLFNLGR